MFMIRIQALRNYLINYRVLISWYVIELHTQLHISYILKYISVTYLIIHSILLVNSITVLNQFLLKSLSQFPTQLFIAHSPRLYSRIKHPLYNRVLACVSHMCLMCVSYAYLPVEYKFATLRFIFLIYVKTLSSFDLSQYFNVCNCIELETLGT